MKNLKYLLFILCLLFVSSCAPKVEDRSNSDYEALMSAEMMIANAKTAAKIERARALLNSIPDTAPEYTKAQEILKTIDEKKMRLATAPPEPRKPKELRQPEIGMNISEFRELCGNGGGTLNDEVGDIKLLTIEMEYTKGQTTNNCWGIFNFYNDELNDIYRPGQ